MKTFKPKMESDQPVGFPRLARGGFILMGVLTALGLSLNAGATEYPTDSAPSVQNDLPPAADNSGINKRDTQSGLPTPENQKENAVDLELTQKIRQSVTADESLSVNARNIKIISRDRVVTLRGPVKSQSEADIIVNKVKGLSGVSKVNNNLEVAQ